VQQGGFPYLATDGLQGDAKTRRDYLGGIYNTVLLKDVVGRIGVKSVDTLERVARFLFDNIGSIVSTRGICNALTSAGHKTTVPTVESYVQSLCDAFICYRLHRYDIKGKEHLRSGVKYYVVDLGLRNFLLGQKMGDVGHVLENVVFLELLRRKHSVFVGKVGSKEVDFVTVDGNDVHYYQVAASVRDPHTLKRELAAFEEIPDHYAKTLLTLDNDPPAIYQGIRQYHALDFLMGKV
jgi:predicted AAA+ superfamily ATPase